MLRLLALAALAGLASSSTAQTCPEGSTPLAESVCLVTDAAVSSVQASAQQRVTDFDSTSVPYTVRLQELFAPDPNTGEESIRIRVIAEWTHVPGTPYYSMTGQSGPGLYNGASGAGEQRYEPRPSFPEAIVAPPGGLVFYAVSVVGLRGNNDEDGWQEIQARTRGFAETFRTSSYGTLSAVQPALRSEVQIAADSVSAGESFDLDVVVTNPWSVRALDVRPAGPLTVTDADGQPIGAVDILEEPAPVDTLPGGASATLRYRVAVQTAGLASVTVPVGATWTEYYRESVEARPICSVDGLRASSASCAVEVVENGLPFTWEQADVPAFRLTFQAPDVTLDGVAITEWTWTFGDGVTGTGPLEVHRYDDPGPVEVALSVVDQNGTRIETTRTVEVGRFGVIIEDDGAVDLVPRPGGQLSLTAADLPDNFPPIVTVGQSAEGGGGLGTVSTGDPKVLFEDRPVSRVGDEVRAYQEYIMFAGDGNFTSGPIVEGESRALVNGVPMAAVPGLALTCCDAGLNQAKLREGLASIAKMKENAIREGIPGWAPTTQLNELIERLGGSPVAQTQLLAPVDPTQTRLEVASNDDFEVGDPVLIVDPDGNAEVSEVAGFGSILLTTPFQRSYPAGSLVSAVRPSGNTTSSEGGLRPEAAAVTAYPNPASGAVTIRYAVPNSSVVRVTVYDTLGREVATLVEDELAEGLYTMPLPTESLAAGVYLIRLSAGPEVVVQQITIAR